MSTSASESNAPAAAAAATAGPGLAARSSIALLMRVVLGLQLLNAGIVNFYTNQWIQGAGPNSGFNLFAQTGVFPGTEAAYAVLPFIQMAVALGVLLGFFTTTAAVLAGLTAAVPLMLQTLALLGVGAAQPSGFGFRGGEMMFMQIMMGGVATINVMLASVLIWFAAAGWNSWSLDTLMYGQLQRSRGARRARPPRKRTSVPGLGGTAEAELDDGDVPDHALFRRGADPRTQAHSGLAVPFSADQVDLPDAP